MRLGRILAAVDAVPREMIALDGVSSEDFHLVANRLVVTAERLRAVAPMYGNDLNIRFEQRRRPSARLRGAA